MKQEKQKLMNDYLFGLLNGRSVTVAVRDSVYGNITSGPFVLTDVSGVPQRIVQRDRFILVVTFRSDAPSVTVYAYDSIRGIEHERTYRIETVIPSVNENGVVQLDLWTHPRFDIDVIRTLYQQLESLDTGLYEQLNLKTHPLVQMKHERELLSVLYGVSLDDCFWLTQLGYIHQTALDLQAVGMSSLTD